MKNGFLALSLVLSTISYSQTYLQLEAAQAFNDTGDLLGESLSGSIGFHLSKAWSVQLSYRASHFGGDSYPEEFYRDTPNLLIRDRWLENYPTVALPSNYDISGYELLPQLSSTRGSAITVDLNYSLPLWRKHNLFLDMTAGGGIARYRSNRIGVIATATVSSQFLDFEGTIVGPSVDAHILPVFKTQLTLNYSIKAWTFGPYLNTNFHDAYRAFMIGVSLRVTPNWEKKTN